MFRDMRAKPPCLIPLAVGVEIDTFSWQGATPEDGTLARHGMTNERCIQVPPSASSVCIPQEKTRQQCTLPAWLSGCANPHQGQPSAADSCLHLSI